MTTIEILIIKPVKKFGTPVFSFKRTRESALQNSSILYTFNGYLGEVIESQKGSLLDYGSEFRDINRIKNLLRHHEEKERIFNIIRKGSRYYLSPIEYATRKYDLEGMLLRGNHKRERSVHNTTALEKLEEKEV